MKKVTKLVLMLCLILSGAFCHASGVAGQENKKGTANAQRSSIVYTEYEPDTVVNHDQNRFTLDIDFDGEDDLQITNFLGGPGDHVTSLDFDIINWASGLTHMTYLWDQEEGLGHDTIQMGDILGDCVTWCTLIYFEYAWDQIDPNVDGFRGYLGIRKKIDEDYYYGWIEFKMFWDTSISIYVPAPSIVLYATAFCTIPNYPLRAGQNSLEWNVGEVGNSAVANIHPNPTNGMVAITGENLQQAEVFNMLGQKLLGVKGKGDELHIDMAALPTGIYFVTVTDEEGRKCVRKVMKE